jgi:apolipoprotein N-acyltransferase
MAFAINSRRAVAALLAILSAALLIWYGNGLDPWWPLLWFAPLPVLLFATRASWWGAALVAAASWLIGGLNLWHYLRVQHAPPTTWVSIFSSAALVFAAAVLLFRALLRRGACWSALLSLPAAWVTVEYLRNLSTPHGTSGSLAYSQLRFLPFLQLASVTGPWGMTFVLLLFPAALAAGLHLRRTAPRQALQVAGAGLGVLALVLILGTARLVLPAPHQLVKVGLIASDEPANDDVAAAGAPTARLFRDYAGEAQKLAALGAQVIVVPEKLGTVTAAETRTDDAIFQSVADRTKAQIVVGLVSGSPPVQYNQARVYAPLAPVRSYDKHHLLPPFESALQPGTALTLMPEPAEAWGVAICKDMDFTPLSRRYGNAGAGLMLVPAWDFVLDASWHGHIALMRGVENGFSIARAAKNGFLTVSDDRGRILAETASNSAPFATLLVDVPTVHDTTLYLLLGDWFAWLAMAILLFTLLRLFTLRQAPVA